MLEVVLTRNIRKKEEGKSKKESGIRKKEERRGTRNDFSRNGLVPEGFSLIWRSLTQGQTQRGRLNSRLKSCFRAWRVQKDEKSREKSWRSICPPPLFSKNIASSKLRKARFWHRPSVHPYSSREISHVPSFGKPDFGTAHLSTPTFLKKYRIFQASESQILAPPICVHPLF